MLRGPWPPELTEQESEKLAGQNVIRVMLWLAHFRCRRWGVDSEWVPHAWECTRALMR